MKTAILGSGSWGTALGILAASNGNPVSLLTRRPEQAEKINQERAHERYLPGVALPDGIVASVDREKILPETKLLLFVVPTSNYRATAEEVKALVPKDCILLTCSKGIERGTGNRMSEILTDVFPDNPVAVLSGPNHAEAVSYTHLTLPTIYSV